MKRKTVAAILATVMAMSVFTGCGSDDKDKGNNETQSTTMGDSITTGDSTTTGSAEAETTISASLDNLTEGEPEISDVTIETDKIIVGQYKGVEIEKVEVEAVSDEDVEDALNELVDEYTTTEDVTDRTDVQDGDIANIDYVGKIDGEAFDGGSDEGFDLEIGSDTFIDGFEEGLIGAKVGETVDVKVTFPDPYDNNTDLSGKEAVFTVTVNSIQAEVVPELTDAFVAENTDYKTIEEYRTAKRAELEAENKEYAEDEKAFAAWEVVLENCAMKEYDKDAVKENAISYKDYMAYMMSYSGYTLDAYVAEMGSTMEEFDEEAVEQGKLAEKERYLVEAIAEKEGLELTDAEYAESLTETYEGYGYESEADFWTAVDEQSIDREEMEQSIRDSKLYEKVTEFVADNAVEVESSTTDGDAEEDAE